MESPKTYHGYDSDDNCITTVTADDATNYINPDEVKQAIDNLEAVLKEQFKGISDALRGIEQDANEAVIVQGTKMSGTIEETCNALDAIPSSVMSQIGDLYNESVQVHDQLQTEFNEKAKNAAWGNNVVRVS